MTNKEIERDWALLYKYRSGRDVDPKDLLLIDGLRWLDLMNKGLSLKRKVITAKTTYQGKSLLPWWYPLKALNDYLRLSWRHFNHRDNVAS